jgi:hypothetical protein
VVISGTKSLTGNSLPGYTLNVIPGSNRDILLVHYAAAAGPDADVSELLRFLDWMENDISHYLSFKYGPDWESHDNMHESYYALWFDEHMKCFERLDWHYDILFYLNPETEFSVGRYREELQPVPPAEGLLDRDEILEIIHYMRRNGIIDHKEGVGIMSYMITPTPWERTWSWAYSAIFNTERTFVNSHLSGYLWASTQPSFDWSKFHEHYSLQNTRVRFHNDFREIFLNSPFTADNRSTRLVVEGLIKEAMARTLEEGGE